MASMAPHGGCCGGLRALLDKYARVLIVFTAILALVDVVGDVLFLSEFVAADCEHEGIPEGRLPSEPVAQGTYCAAPGYVQFYNTTALREAYATYIASDQGSITNIAGTVTASDPYEDDVVLMRANEYIYGLDGDVCSIVDEATRRLSSGFNIGACPPPPAVSEACISRTQSPCLNATECFTDPDDWLDQCFLPKTEVFSPSEFGVHSSDIGDEYYLKSEDYTEWGADGAATGYPAQTFAVLLLASIVSKELLKLLALLSCLCAPGFRKPVAFKFIANSPFLLLMLPCHGGRFWDLAERTRREENRAFALLVDMVFEDLPQLVLPILILVVNGNADFVAVFSIAGTIVVLLVNLVSFVYGCCMAIDTERKRFEAESEMAAREDGSSSSMSTGMELAATAAPAAAATAADSGLAEQVALLARRLDEHSHWQEERGQQLDEQGARIAALEAGATR